MMQYQKTADLYDDYLYAGGIQSMSEIEWCAGELNLHPTTYLIYLTDALAFETSIND